MKQWFARIVLGPDYYIVRFKSWRPSIGPYGVEWPTMLVDRRGCYRSTITPVWDRQHFKVLFYRLKNGDDKLKEESTNELQD